jgi:hypothetical protein
MFVLFQDAGKKKIVSVFDSPQSESDFPNQGVVEDTDPRYIEFITPKAVENLTDPVEKLKAFLDDNPDVAEILK